MYQARRPGVRNPNSYLVALVLSKSVFVTHQNIKRLVVKIVGKLRANNIFRNFFKKEVIRKLKKTRK